VVSRPQKKRKRARRFSCARPPASAFKFFSITLSGRAVQSPDEMGYCSQREGFFYGALQRRRKSGRDRGHAAGLVK